jgi:hypothetical protein
MAATREGAIAAAQGWSGDGGFGTKRLCLPAPPAVGAERARPDRNATGSTEVRGQGGSHGPGPSATVRGRTRIVWTTPRTGPPHAPTDAVRGNATARLPLMDAPTTRIAGSHGGTARHGSDDRAFAPLLRERLGVPAGMCGDIGAGAAPRR